MCFVTFLCHRWEFAQFDCAKALNSEEDDVGAKSERGDVLPPQANDGQSQCFVCLTYHKDGDGDEYRDDAVALNFGEGSLVTDLHRIIAKVRFFRFKCTFLVPYALR